MATVAKRTGETGRGRRPLQGRRREAGPEGPEELRSLADELGDDPEDSRARRPGEESDDEIGESMSRSATAPASSGLVHGTSGTVDPDADVLDTAGKRPPRSGKGETPVPSPSGGADAGGRVQTGSAGAASISAGSAPPQEGAAGSENEDREVLGGIGDAKHGGRRPRR